MIKYTLPTDWIRYDQTSVELMEAYAEAKASVLALQTVPLQRRWVEELQAVELKREVAGTSRIEGAEFTDQELDQALLESPDHLTTRSQRQAHAVVNTYRWIASLPRDQPITRDLICEIHRRVVTDADDDHCPPGKVRKDNQNVNFGLPPHQGVEGGRECDDAFRQFTDALHTAYRDRPPMMQALAAHYHFAAMHPFLDGNGRTARALEALMLQRAGLHDTCFIAMSNYYYEEKPAYLAALAAVAGQHGHDLTSFLIFGLKGVVAQSKQLLGRIQRRLSGELYRNLMHELFGRLKSKRKRVLAERQIELLKILLDMESMDVEQLRARTAPMYGTLKDPWSGLGRDLVNLRDLGAIDIEQVGEDQWRASVRLSWPTEITETEFFEKIKHYPKAKTLSFV